jgi:(p)ppGpp synthase/HD superfamily hydrolase
MTDNKPTLWDALLFAAHAHGAVGQNRKGTGFPYVVHPIRVAETLHLYGADDEVVTAGFLHDVIEDAGVTYEQIEERFGPRVAAIVAGASEPDKTASWKERKQHTIDYIRGEADEDTLLVAAADKLDNARSIRETLRLEGEEKTWARFNEGRTEQHWYYRALAEAFLFRDPENTLFRMLDDETRELFAD